MAALTQHRYFRNRVTQTPLQGGYSFNPTINPANNHITTSGYTYDAAGNMTNDSFHTYTYDAEGNVTQVDGGSTAQYVYDVFNRRIHVQTPSATTEYTYDYAGRRISSWLSPNNTGVEGRIYWEGQQFGYRSSDGTTYFDHQDTLGTERMRTDFGAGAGSSYASLPWGDGYSATIGLAGADQDNEHFAGMEQDENTSNVPMSEHAQFRQYSFLQGRWLAPDPYMGSYDPTNPQSMNRYAYVLNNPLSFIDPTGLDYGFDCGDNCVGVEGTTDDPVNFDGPTRTTSMPLRPPNVGPVRPPKKTTCKTGFGAGILVGADAGTGLGFVGAGGNVGAGVGLFGGNGINAGAFASGGVGGNFGSQGASAPSANLNGRNFVGAGGGVGAGIFLTNASQASQLSGPFATWNVDLGWLANGAAQFAAGTDSVGNTIWTFSFTLGVGGGGLYHNITTNTVVKGTGKGGC